MNKLKPWIALAAVVVVAVLAGGWFLVVEPKHHRAADLRAQAVQQDDTNARSRTQLQVLQAEAAALPQEQTVLADVAQKLPADAQQPALVRALQDAAAQAGVEFVSLAPGATTAPSGTPVSSSAGTLQTVPVTITVAGGYYQLQQYLTALETLPRALRITNLAIVDGASPVAPTGSTAQVDDGKHLLVTITGSVFVAAGASPLRQVPAAPATATK